MSDGISPLDRARYPDNILDRIAQLEAQVRGLQGTNVQAQNLLEVAPDVWGLNASFPSICQGRLTLVSGNPVPLAATISSTIYFTPYIGNLIGIYNGSSSVWSQIPFSELSLPIQNTQNGTTHNGTAVIDGLTDTSQLVVNMEVSGAGIPVGTQIQSIDSTTQITLSANSTASATVSITFSWFPNTDIDIFIIDAGNGQLALRMLPWTFRSGSIITGATNASPIVLTCGLGASLTANVGHIIDVENVLGATGANGTWRVGARSATTITLLNLDGTNSAAGGVYSGPNQGTARWATDTNSIPRISALTLQDGIYVLASNPTWRYLGTAHIGHDRKVTDSIKLRCLWNYYNRKFRPMRAIDGGASWNVAVASTWQPTHNDVSNRVEFVIGIIEDYLAAKMTEVFQTVSNTTGEAGLLMDVATGAPAYFGEARNANASAVRSQVYAGVLDPYLYITATEGYHFVQGMEFGSSTTNVTVLGSGETLLEASVWG